MDLTTIASSLVTTNSTMMNMTTWMPASDLLLAEPNSTISSAMNSSALSDLIAVTESALNGTNMTSATTAQMANATPMLKKVHDWLISALLISVMFAMGCSITWEQVMSHLRRPVGILTGMLSQFFLLPFSAYLLVHFLKIAPLHAAGLLILASSPGGVTSNLFTYFCDGDVSLSVTMTTMSTIVALFMMPFNVWLYGRSLESDTIVIPYAKMSSSLFILSAPVVGGMLVYWKFPKVAPILTKIGSFSGFAIIVVCEALEVMIFPDIFDNVPSQIYVAEFVLPVMGMGLGFGLASIFKLPYPFRRTIAIEAGVQNVGTALAIVSLSYPFKQLKQVWLFPFLYAFSMLAVCVVIAVVYQSYKRICGRSFDIECDPSKLAKLHELDSKSHKIVTVEVMRMPTIQPVMTMMPSQP